ncbi:uncharacterized protein BDR25DRAFT_368763 [Lindgomyces ingoldianus]|uniref:Uncharacterized protein n=1 Tax=Lindgomyces ingoldianus TaxID=673940 RepID=A0ACB6QY76_9PLEO|nr:uncharacterized protein BDR25DRAFT_368763 [Lindgomyces ingoldianus]KAF2471037.1 hypothetical protein BDR25DRAFT_368763 [Lindgomyces ingoldianus]
MLITLSPHGEPSSQAFSGFGRPGVGFVAVIRRGGCAASRLVRPARFGSAMGSHGRAQGPAILIQPLLRRSPAMMGDISGLTFAINADHLSEYQRRATMNPQASAATRLQLTSQHLLNLHEPAFAPSHAGPPSVTPQPSTQFVPMRLGSCNKQARLLRTSRATNVEESRQSISPSSFTGPPKLCLRSADKAKRQTSFPSGKLVVAAAALPPLLQRSRGEKLTCMDFALLALNISTRTSLAHLTASTNSEKAQQSCIKANGRKRD